MGELRPPRHSLRREAYRGGTPLRLGEDVFLFNNNPVLHVVEAQKRTPLLSRGIPMYRLNRDNGRVVAPKAPIKIVVINPWSRFTSMGEEEGYAQHWCCDRALVRAGVMSGGLERMTLSARRDRRGGMSDGRE